MIFDKKKMIKRMLEDVSLAYVASALVIIIVRAVFAFLNDEAILENVMLNLRTFLLGVIDAREYFFVARIESIGFYAIHLSVFFALFFNYIFDKKGIFIVFILGVIIIILCKLRFLLCIHIGMCLSLVFYLILSFFVEKKGFLPVFRVLLLLCTVFPIVTEIIKNMQ